MQIKETNKGYVIRRFSLWYGGWLYLVNPSKCMPLENKDAWLPKRKAPFGVEKRFIPTECYFNHKAEAAGRMAAYQDGFRYKNCRCHK